MEGDVITLNDIFQFEVLGEGADGRLFGKYHVSRVPPSFLKRLSYFGLDRAWRAALEEAEHGCPPAAMCHASLIEFGQSGSPATDD